MIPAMSRDTVDRQSTLILGMKLNVTTSLGDANSGTEKKGAFHVCGWAGELKMMMNRQCLLLFNWDKCNNALRLIRPGTRPTISADEATQSLSLHYRATWRRQLGPAKRSRSQYPLCLPLFVFHGSESWLGRVSREVMFSTCWRCPFIQVEILSVSTSLHLFHQLPCFQNTLELLIK